MNTCEHGSYETKRVSGVLWHPPAHNDVLQRGAMGDDGDQTPTKRVSPVWRGLGSCDELDVEDALEVL